MNALEIISFISYSSNTEISKVSSWGAVKKESLNGLNRALRVLWNINEWNFRREILNEKIDNNKPTLSMPNAIIADNGLILDGEALIFDKNIPFYDEQTGKPQKYYIDNKDRIRFYPKPDKEYNLKIEVFHTLPIVGEDGNLKRNITASTDTLNISERLEDLFVDCLTYFCNEILNGDPQDEEYQEHALREAEVYKLLLKADLSTFDFDNDKGFLMPWQQ